MTSPSTESDYILRRATIKDFDAIRLLSKHAHQDNYKIDYLAGDLLKYLSDPFRIIHVAERKKDRSLIALAMGFGGLDDELTFHTEAGRVHPDFQRQGLMALVIYSCWVDFNKSWPRWKYMRGSSVTPNYSQLMGDKIEVLCERIWICISATHNKLKTYLESDINNTDDNIMSLSPSQYSNLLLDEKMSKFLYPEGYMVMEFNVFNAWSSNVPFVMRNHDNIFLSGNQSKSGLSLGGHLPVDDDKAWRYNFNYTGATDLDICEAHMRKHILAHVNHTKKKIDNYLMLMLPKCFLEKYGEAYLMEYWRSCFHLSPSDISFSVQCVVDFKYNANPLISQL